MRIEINIRNSHFLVILLFIIAVSAVGLVVAYGGIQPSIMGHSWGEVSCPGCITNTNLADGSVTSAKIQDASITSADISSIDGSKITGTVPNADTVDGYHASSWGGVCNPVYSACSSCCGDGTRTCSYMGIQLTVRGTTMCVATGSSQGSCASQSCSDSSCCSGGWTTPYLFTYAGGRYLIENDVMDTFFQVGDMSVKDTENAYKNNQLGTSYTERDIYKLKIEPETTSGSIRLQLRELEPEESNFDSVQLVKVYHNQDSLVYSDNDKIYSARLTAIKPLSCTDENNDDCLDAIANDDAQYVRKGEGSYIIITFRADDTKGRNILSMASSENNWVPKFIASPLEDGHSAASLVTSYLEDGQWQRISRDYHPREIKSNEYGMADLNEYLDEEGRITLKIEWTDTHSVDKVNIVNVKELPMRQEVLQLKRAIHSTDGDVTTSLLNKDFVYAHTVRGDSIDLEFNAGKMQPGTGEAVDYFFVSEGYYHGLRTYLYPGVDTSDSFKAEVNKYIEELNGYLGVAN